MQYCGKRSGLERITPYVRPPFEVRFLFFEIWRQHQPCRRKSHAERDGTHTEHSATAPHPYPTHYDGEDKPDS